MADTTRQLAIRRLFEAGYDYRLGAGGLGHLQILRKTKYGWRIRPGQRAVCGATARRMDYKQKTEPCQDCLREVLQPDGEGGYNLIPAAVLVEMRQAQNE